MHESNAVDNIYQVVFRKQLGNKQLIKQHNVEERKNKIKRILDYILKNTDLLNEALHKDLKKSPEEIALSELGIMISEAKMIIKKLKQWIKPKSVWPTSQLIGTDSYIHMEPKGCVLIISPWNYPFLLAVKPLLYAIAAGNTAIIKPSEMSPHTSSFINNMITDLFDESEVKVFEGDHEVSKGLLRLPFDHIYFTGSPKVGSIVMKAASDHLTSVTLELGGKSPAIVDQSADLNDAASKIAWGKTFNAGQTCIAPDYLLIHQDVKAELLEKVKVQLERMYGDVEKTRDYGRIINENHFFRLKSLLVDAFDNGAENYFGGTFNQNDLFISPTILDKVNHQMRLMQEEIFGPILPVISFESLDEALRIVNALPKPLAFYIFSKSRNVIDDLMRYSSAGSTILNDTLIQFAHSNLPFGGVNTSGIGRSGGYSGFKEFSNERGVVIRKFNSLKYLYPPYNKQKRKLIDAVIKYL
ncbi:MAG TPA: aldehyde dehydrogenase family protein [Cyclobacteriaceae bacterium]